MNSTVQTIDLFHQSKRGKIIFGAVEILLAYVIVSRAFDTGSLWEYFFSIVLLVGGANNIVRAFIGPKNNVKKNRKKH